MSSTKSNVPCYVLLVGKVGPTSSSNLTRDLTLHVKDLPCTLGRAPYAKGHIMVDDQDSTLSREHIKIQWNTHNGCYEISCLSKNGAVINRARVKKGETVDVHANSALRIGSAKFYISIPIDLVEGGAATIAAEKAAATMQLEPSQGNASTNNMTQTQSQVSTISSATNTASSTKKRKILNANSPIMASNTAEDSQGPPMKITKLSSSDTTLDNNIQGKQSSNPNVIRSTNSSGTSSTSASSANAELLAKAFASGQLPQSEGGGIEQAALHAWFVETGNMVQEDITSSFKKSIYSLLSRKYIRVESDIGVDVGKKKQPIRWTQKET